MYLPACSDLAALPHALCDPETWSPAAAAPGVTISRGTVRYSNTALKLPHSDPAQGPEVALESVSVGCPDSGPRSQRSCSMGWVDGAGALAAVGSALLAAAGAHAAHSAEGGGGSTGGGEVVLLAVAANVSLAAGSWAPLAVPRGVTLRLQGVPTQSERAVEIDFGGLPGALSLAPSPSSRLALSDLLLRGLAYPPAISRQEHLLGAFLHAAGQPW
ncbi:hypothetical protein HYH03_017598 [Edaphochlamys debaryana]|uniref:Uncharacterized protein n=1 Tax=Edaphochlamys debaryana TaxID=47281 RepID=A0A835XNY7_9CHLO|nr:hypothetical protein HYH03_017598 [Edaphochlamys debaryana]|eukprot:KAG2483544.1 hypothetical protein HYH03_017598 [Edaphochlamys debaryana]